MMLAEAVRQGAAYLQEAGSPSARLDAEVLLAHVLGLRRVDLYLRGERVLAAGEQSSFRALLERRARKEPVCYLVGQKEFFGLNFLVDHRVLVPRPETEVLVERALECARALGREDLVIADIGTGSGSIVVALASRLPRASFYATDVSPEALEVAGENVRRHGVEGRVSLLLGDLCGPLPGAVDFLVSNPPYTVWETLPLEITAYEPRVALDGGRDGLEVCRRLLPQAREVLGPAGSVLVEVGDGQEGEVQALARGVFPGSPLRTWPDYSGIPRVVEIGPCGCSPYEKKRAGPGRLGRPAKEGSGSPLARLVHSAQAASAHPQADALPPDVERALLHIGHPAPVGAALGVTHVVSVLQRLAAQFASTGHRVHPHWYKVAGPSGNPVRGRGRHYSIRFTS